MSHRFNPNVNNPSMDVRTSIPPFARDLLAQQAGQILVEFGNLFVNLAPFSEHVDRKTAEMLISIGKKLKK